MEALSAGASRSQNCGTPYVHTSLGLLFSLPTGCIKDKRLADKPSGTVWDAADKIQPRSIVQSMSFASNCASFVDESQ